jgi:hypothetical protein
VLFFSLFVNEAGVTECHDCAIASRMIEAASRKNETVEMGHGEARWLPFGKVAQHAACAAAMPIESASLAPEKCWRAVRLAFDDVGNVAKGCCVQERVNGLVIVKAASVPPLDAVDYVNRIAR